MILNPNRKPASLAEAVKGSILVPALICAVIGGGISGGHALRAALAQGPHWTFTTVQSR